MPGILSFDRWGAFQDTFEPYRAWTLCGDVPGLDLRVAADLDRAVTLDDDVPSFHNNLGSALEQVGRFSSAAEASRSALLVDPATGENGRRREGDPLVGKLVK